MLEERNVYWTYCNKNHQWKSKKFMDFTGEILPEKISTSAYTKRGIHAKKPLWISVPLYSEKNPKMAASKIASTLISVALAPRQSIDILFNQLNNTTIFVLDCQHLINIFSCNVVDEKYTYIEDVQNLIFNLFIETDVAAQYKIDKKNKLCFEFINISNFKHLKCSINRIILYKQCSFFEKLYSYFNENIHLFKRLINRLSRCYVFSEMKRSIIDHRYIENIRFASGLLQKATNNIEVSFLATHLAMENEALREPSLDDKKKMFKEILWSKCRLVPRWNCKKLCRNPCGLHHPLDALAFDGKKQMNCEEEINFSLTPKSPEGITPRLLKAIDLCMDELSVFLFFASYLLGFKKLTLNGSNIPVSFAFLFVNHAPHVAEKILSLNSRLLFLTNCNNKQLTKHEIANSLREQNNVNFIGFEDSGTDLISILLKRSRTSSKDIYKISQSFSSNNERKEDGILNCISFCTKETLLKFYKSKTFRSGIMKYLIPISPNLNQHNFSTDRLEELLSIFKKNITNIDECDRIFIEMCNEFYNKLNLLDKYFTGDLKTFPNYIKIIFFLVIITLDEKSHETLPGERNRDYYINIMITANFLNNNLEIHKNKSTIDFKLEKLEQSLKNFLSRYRYKYIYERELIRPFLGSHKKEQIAKVIRNLCTKRILIKGGGKIPLRVGRKSSPVYEIMLLRS